MKKYLFGLCALLACFVLSSCGGNPTETLKDLAKEIEDADKISAQDAYNIQKKALEAQIDFYKGDPTEEEIDEFKDALKEYDSAKFGMLSKLDDDFMKDAKDMDDEDKELDELKDELSKVKKEFNKKQKDKKDKDED